MQEAGIFAPIEIENINKEEEKEVLGELQRLCTLYKTQQSKIETLKDDLKKAEKNLEITSRTHIPELLKTYGLAEIKLDTGEKVEIQDQLKVSLSQVQTNAAIQTMIYLQFDEDFDYLISKKEEEVRNEKDREDKSLRVYEVEEVAFEARKFSTEKIMSLFKQKLTIEGTEEDVKNVKNYLDENNISYDFGLTIHHMTLTKYCKDRRASGRPVPEQINVFPYKETKIK